MRISLRAGERIYINGAVLRADRKLTFELLNNANFLLENHILQAEDATTPLRQLYFALQTLMIEPSSNTARDAYLRIAAAAREAFSTTDVVVGLRLVGRLVESGRIFEALKTLRSLFAVEATILNANTKTQYQEMLQEQDDGREQYNIDQQRGGLNGYAVEGHRHG
jgi:flagellar protein FlbT